MLSECLYCGYPVPSSGESVEAWVIAEIPRTIHGAMLAYCCPACFARSRGDLDTILNSLGRHIMAVLDGQDEKARIAALRATTIAVLCDTCGEYLKAPAPAYITNKAGRAAGGSLFASSEAATKAAIDSGWECMGEKLTCPSCVGARVPC